MGTVPVSHANASRVPTELESCVLGFIAEEGPCTAYVIRRRLAQSLSSYWRASAGTIYPLVQRLEARGWIKAEVGPRGSRIRRAYSLTSAGRNRIKQWLSVPIPISAVAFTHDPIRTRVFFLHLIPLAQRATYIEDAITQTQNLIDAHRSVVLSLPSTTSPYEKLGEEGVILALKARLQCLQKIQRFINKNSSGES